MAIKKAKAEHHPGLIILIVLFALLGIGTIMIYSSSAIYALKNWGNTSHFLIKQIFNLAIGLVALRISLKVDYKVYQKLVPFLMVSTFVLLLLILIPGIGTEVGNARRWIRIFGFGFQPSELLKFTLITWLASFLGRKKELLGLFSQSLLPVLTVLGVFFFLLLLQPDFGTAVLISITLLAMIFVAGARLSHLFLSLSGIGGLAFLLIISKSYRMRRITGFLDPWADPLDTGFQLIQSFIAFSTGGVFGLGLGNSRQKLFFLPEAHTDFILAILAEEAGLIGVIVVLGLLVTLMVKGFEIAGHCQEDFGKSLAFGITMLISLQSFLNFGVVMGLLPTKGIPLPFISYGGSSLVINMFMVGVLVNIARYNDRQDAKGQ
ncbi:MAG: putative lipid II flippase FtsW [SAR324 cluster bacterium]|nr:putative lipid II flippase FtsW [SAR324 cluster bacterium]